MSTIHIIQTIFEIVLIVAVIFGFVYEPILIAWEDKQKEKVLKAFKERRAHRK